MIRGSVRSAIRPAIRSPIALEQGGVVVYDADAQAFFDALSDALANSVKSAVSDFITALKTASAWDDFGGLWLYDLPTADSRYRNVANPSLVGTVGSAISYDGINGIYGTATTDGVVTLTGVSGDVTGAPVGFMLAHVVEEATSLAAVMGTLSSRLSMQHGSTFEPRVVLNTSGGAVQSVATSANGDYILGTRADSSNVEFQLNSVRVTAARNYVTGGHITPMGIYGYGGGAFTGSTAKMDVVGYGTTYISEAKANAIFAAHAVYKAALAAAYA